MQNMILLVHSFPKANEAFARHYEFYKKSGATRIVGIGTTNNQCKVPDFCENVNIGEDRYISGRHLPQRLVDTLKWGLEHSDNEHIAVAEYDTLFFHHLPVERMEHGVAAHYAGSSTWGSRAGFFHNPWLFNREVAEKFVKVGQEAIDSGMCDRERGIPDPPEASPDVFFGACVQEYEISVNKDLWPAFSRNSFDIPGDLELAREAYRKGVTTIHGIKTKKELEFILS